MATVALPQVRGLPVYDLSCGDVGRVLGVTSDTVRDWARKKKIPSPVCVGGTWRFSSVEIAEFLERSKLGT